MVALAAYMWLRSRRQPVSSGNVNEQWTEATDPAAPVTAGI